MIIRIPNYKERCSKTTLNSKMKIFEEKQRLRQQKMNKAKVAIPIRKEVDSND